MNIWMQSGAESTYLNVTPWQAAIIGDIVDDRGAAAQEFAREHSTTVHSLSYDPRSFQVTFDGTVLSAEDLETLILSRAFQSLLLETTTLGFVEILLCCRAYRQLKQDS